MIVSEKYRYVFIGLPFSASSAISKHLYEKYDGKPYLRKHSVYYEFKKHATNQQLKYFVFAVIRNPMEIVATIYEKLKTNPQGMYTNPKLYKENGGYISKKQRNKHRFIKEKNATFQQFFLKFYKKPYDNLSSLTIQHCDFVIRYETIQEDYKVALQKIGVSNSEKLPIHNKSKTKQKDLKAYYTDDIKQQAIKVFGPYMKKNRLNFPSNFGSVTI